MYTSYLSTYCLLPYWVVMIHLASSSTIATLVPMFLVPPMLFVEIYARIC
jgi:hypothetical protein